MLFAKKVRELMESKQMLKGNTSAVLDIDKVMYYKIERVDRQAKREHITAIAKILQVDPEELLALWLADQVAEVVENEKVADRALELVKEKIKL